jgi:DNA repair protein RadD
MELRPYQAEGIGRLRQHLRDGARSVLWQMPTGAGKTASTAYMLRGAAERGKRAWFIVHRRELILQSHRAFQKAGVPHGIIAAGFDLATRQPVQICSVQTLARRLDRLQPPDLIVWDECHHLAAGSWGAIYERFPKAVHIGLSATPQRLDGQGLDGYFRHMVRGPSVRELIDGGYLVPYRLFAPSSPDLTGVHTRMGDYVRAEAAAAMDKPRIVGDCVEHYRRLAMGRRAVVFAVSIEASHRIVQGFQAAGIPAAHVDGETAADQRDAAIRAFERGETRVLSNVDLFGEGFDLPAIEAVILMRPTQSLSLYLQQVGRGLRSSPGKADCVILDHAGNCQRHGLPDEPREWTLAGGLAGVSRDASEDNGPPIRQCASCYAISPAGMEKCRECGTAFPVKVRAVAEVEGNLEEVAVMQVRRQAKREQAGADSLQALIELGRMRGYKNPAGWAQYVWRAREKRRA